MDSGNLRRRLTGDTIETAPAQLHKHLDGLFSAG
jgi:uncharacterized protein (DUF2267 family)